MDFIKELKKTFGDDPDSWTKFTSITHFYSTNGWDSDQYKCKNLREIFILISENLDLALKDENAYIREFAELIERFGVDHDGI